MELKFSYHLSAYFSEPKQSVNHVMKLIMLI